MDPKNEDVSAESSTAEQSTSSGVDAGSPPAGGEGATTSDSPTEQEGQSTQAQESYSEGLMGAIAEATSDAPDTDSLEGTDGPPGESGEQDQDTEKGDSDADSDKSSQEESDEETDEDGKKLPPFHKHPRWQEMVRERNQLREEAQELRAATEDYRKVQDFMRENDLGSDEVAEAVQIAALIRNDPETARQRLSSVMERLDGFVGERLPEDLQRDVDEGYVTEERAKELARLRNQSHFREQQAQRERQRAEQVQRQTQEEQRRQQATQILQQQQQAVRAWEQDIKSRDPDYERIQPLVYKELRLLAREATDRGRPPRSTDDAVALAKQAHQNVKEQVRRIQGPRQQVSPGPSSSQVGSSTGGQSQPGSFMEAVLQAASSS